MEINLKNYRCFTDAAPAKFSIGEGFTAFVGQNNAGKSTALRFFYEFRDFFRRIGESSGEFEVSISGREFGFSLTGVTDISEIFSNSNSRPLEFEISMPSVKPNAISRAVFRMEGREGVSVRASYFSNNALVRRNEGDGFSRKSEGRFRLREEWYDASEFWAFTDAIASSIYIGPFRNAINQGASDYYDIGVGTGFINAWADWKTGVVRANNRAVIETTDAIRRIFEFDDLDVSASPDRSVLHLTVNRQPYSLNELGSGLSQFIVVLGNVMIKRPKLILIDEPELNLHPALQIDFLTTLASHAPKGVIFATHSLGLARSLSDNIHTFRRGAGRIEVRPFGPAPNYAEFLGEMSFSGYQALGYEKLLLVEGVHDVATAQQFLRMRGRDHQVVVLPLGGDSLARAGVENELAEIKRLSAEVFVLVDSERPDEASPPAQRRKAFAVACETLGFQVCVTKRRAIENYFSDAAVKTVKGPDYAALGPYERLAASQKPWGKADNWRIARAMALQDLAGTDVGDLLAKL